MTATNTPAPRGSVRMDNVLIVVDDLEGAKAFFLDLGLELEGQMTVEGGWVDKVVGLEKVSQSAGGEKSAGTRALQHPGIAANHVRSR
jgi:catechol 2,3-dioxygenase-like lactoylglutathione lyase family enzyme